MRVTFVCTGNICRSPMAAAVLRHLVADAGLGDQLEVDSYGLGPWHVGEPAQPHARAALVDRGYDPSHSARQMTPEDIPRYDLIVALAAEHERLLRQYDVPVRLLRSYDGEEADVEDPYGGDRADYEAALDVIEPACRALFAELRERV